jgi:hypothetical protein
LLKLRRFLLGEHIGTPSIKEQDSHNTLTSQ